jgi:EpsI family protein
MKNRLSYIAMLVFLLCSAAFAQYLGRGGGRERIPPRAPLAEFPTQFGEWRQVEEQRLGAGELRELGPDDYLSRTYVNDDGAPVYLFIAYYASQRQRQTFHSPQNCLPGAGWTMSGRRLHSLDGAGADRINEYLIEKDSAKMVALYWYQGRGRVVANEYWGRLYTIRDSMALGRTDGALVRVIAPVGKADGADEQARATALDFARKLAPTLPAYIPN